MAFFRSDAGTRDRTRHRRRSPLAYAPVTYAAATVPQDFADQPIASVGAPTALAFTPDGRLLIATQAGNLRVLTDGALQPTPALALGSRVCTNSERGLLGVAVDPNFATNRFIYIFYTFNKFGNTCRRTHRPAR